MIPISTFNALVVINILFIIYSVVDHRNRLYANITIAFLAALLSAFLGVAIISEAVYEVVGTTMVSLDSPSVGYFMYLISTVMFAYALFMIYEVINEQFEEKKNREEQELKGEDWQ